MSEKPPQRIPDWLHLILSLVFSVLALILVYSIVFVISDLVSSHLFALDLTDRWIGIISISLAFLITYGWIRRYRARTQPVNWKRNLRWSANLIILVFIAFLGFIAFKIYSKDIALPQLEQYIPSSTPADSNSTSLDSTASDSAHFEEMVMDSAHSSLDSLAED